VSEPDNGWSQGVVRKISRLLSARLVAQVIGIGWFLVLARVLDAGELGVLSAGLVSFAAVSVVADLGTTWSIARIVTAEPAQAWPVYVQAVVIRMTSIAVVGTALVAVAAPLVEGRVLLAIAIGIGIAFASGLAELGMSTLRSLGKVRMESLALPLERLGFVALASVVIGSGRGANAVLLVYLFTNAVTAALSLRVLRRDLRPVRPETVARLWSAETRRVGVAFAVLALGPRANALVLVMLASRLEVADYSVASRPVEQLALTVIGFGTTMLPLLRNDAETGADPGARVGAIAAAVVLAALPGVLWVTLDPSAAIDLLYGADRYPGAPLVLSLVALVTITWPLRGLAGIVMVAREQASELARISLFGLALNLAAAIPLIAIHGAGGAAAALVITDLVTAVVLIVRAKVAVPAGLERPLTAAVGIAVASGVAASVAPTLVAPVLVGVGTVLSVGIGLRANRSLARTGEVSWA
jgi:O-antigen/teichoic acid export membrane protein